MAIKRKDRPSPEIPLTSTADVAFLLLVFFLVAASNQRDTGAALDLPGTVKTAPQDDARQLTLVVKQNLYQLNDQIVRGDAEMAAELRKRLANRKAPADRVVLLVADKAVDYQRWTTAMAAVESAGGIPAPQIDEEGARPARPAEGGEGP